MDYETSFLSICNYLNEHTYLHELEVMERFPYPLKDPYHEWVLEIMNLSDEQLIELECRSKTSFLSSKSFIAFVKKSRELCKIPTLKVEPSSIPKELNRKLTPKKAHEIQTIKGIINKLGHLETIIDIGSGAAHLSSSLVCENGLFSYCIDMNEDFQNSGKNKLKKWSPKTLEKLRFINHKVESAKKFNFSFNPQTTALIGLHACGPLTTFIIKSFENNECRDLISFGCCYHKLIDEYNISKISKENAIHFTNHALTMAAKGHTIFDMQEFKKRIRVKNYRYTLHFYCQEILNIPFQTLGNARKSDYQGRFSEYALNYIKADTKHLEDYYNSESNQFNVRYAICAGVIRSKLARVIELYLNLDRALYLIEKGYKVSLSEVFDRTYGPRNLGLIASKN